MLSRLPALLLRGRYDVVHACEESAILAAALKPIFGFRLLYDMDDILSQRTALLASLPAVFARRRDAVCVIVGGERDQIADYPRAAAGLGVASRVRWLGKRDLNETFELLRAADVLVAPLTQPKAVPMKLYAYLSSGVPIVATDLDSHTQLPDRRTASPDTSGFSSLQRTSTR